MRVVPLKESSRKKSPEQQERRKPITEAKREEIDAVVPTVWVSLVHAVALLPHQIRLVEARVKEPPEQGRPLLLEPATRDAAHILVSNPTA